MGREGAHRRGAGGLCAGRLDPLGGRSGAGDGYDRHLQEPGKRGFVRGDRRESEGLPRLARSRATGRICGSTPPIVKVRQNGRIVSVAVIVAVGVNSDGRREVLGMDIGPSEAETFWTAFLRKLARRGLRGVKLVVSDAHEGIKATVAKVLNATWQRSPCPLHAQRAGACRQRADGVSSPPSSPLRCPGRCRGRTSAMAEGRRSAPSQATLARRLPRRCRDRRAGLYDVPAAATHQAALDQPDRAPQRRDQAQDQGRRHLPR